MDWKLELVILPVSDVDRAKAFYVDKAGFNADHDATVSERIRFVQLTPPGSACSIAIGKGIVDTAPGSVAGLQLVVADVDAARTKLVEGGVDVTEVQDVPWGKFVFFGDPDGNRWSVQEIPPRGGRARSVGRAGRAARATGAPPAACGVRRPACRGRSRASGASRARSDAPARVSV